MKKAILFLSGLALLMAGCNKVETMDAPAEDTTMESPRHLTVDIDVNFASETRSAKSGWEVGDVIYVAFDHFFTTESNFDVGSPEPAYYMTLTYDGVTWQSEFSDDALEKYLLNQTSGTLAAFYCSTMDSPLQYSFTPKLGIVGRLSPTPYPDVAGFSLRASSSDGVPYSVTNGRLTASLPMAVLPTSVYFFIEGIPAADASRYSFREKSDIVCYLQVPNFLVRNTKTDMSGEWRTPSVNQNAVNTRSIPAVSYGNGIFFCAGFLYTSGSYSVIGQETEYVIQIIDNKGTPDDDSDDVVYSLTKTATLNGKEQIQLPPLTDPKWVKSHLNPSETRGFLNGHEWVLMADGRKWATMNVGADREIDAGFMTKLANTEALIREYMGDGWRLPTTSEWISLFDNDYHQLNRVYFDSGRFAGLEVVVDSYNLGESLHGNRILLPSSGYMDENSNDLGGRNGYFWSTSSSADPGTTYVFICYEENSRLYSFTDMDINYKVPFRVIVDE